MAIPTVWTEERVAEMRAILARHTSVSAARREAAALWGPIDSSSLRMAMQRIYDRSPSEMLASAAVTSEADQREAANLLQELRSHTPHRPDVPAVVRGGWSAVLLIGDLHIGGGDTPATLERLESIAPKIAHVAGGECSADEIVICFLGDVVDGEGIWWGQWAHNDVGPATAQMRHVTRPIWELLLALHEIAPVRAHATPGNHGRTSVGIGSLAANWDVAVYQQLELLCDLAVVGGPTWSHTEDRDVHIVDVRDYRGVITHGGGRGKLRLPPQWQTASGSRSWLECADLHQADWIACGHLHHPTIGRRAGRTYAINGALGRTDAERISKRDNPACWLLACSDDRPLLPIELLEWGI